MIKKCLVCLSFVFKQQTVKDLCKSCIDQYSKTIEDKLNNRNKE